MNTDMSVFMSTYAQQASAQIETPVFDAFLNHTFDYLFSLRMDLFSHFLKSDMTFGYCLKRGTVQIQPLLNDS